MTTATAEVTNAMGDNAARRVLALDRTAQRLRRQSGYRGGDRLLARVTGTAGRDVVASVVVRATVPLGCGCVRLICDRPGPVTAPNGLHLLTGCGIHERQT